MKLSTLLLLILIPLSGFSQESSKKKIRFGANISPNYSYRTLRYSKSIENLVAIREETEHAGLGFNAGIFGRYSILENFEIELGLQFSNQTHKFKNIPITNNIAAIIGEANLKYNYNYVELPFRVNYKFINREKFLIYSSLGASVNILVNSNSKTKLAFNDGSKSTEKNSSALLNPNRSAYSFQFAIGVGYPLNETINLRFEPILRYSLTPLADAAIQQYNYSFGGQFSISRRL